MISRPILISKKYLLVLFVASLLSGYLLAQCTDADADGYYYELGCGTARDCNDASASTHPGASEICNGFDDDCDGSLDEGCDSSCNNPEKITQDTRVTNDSNESIYPSMVWTGGSYGVAWHDNRNLNYEIYFTRLDSSGMKIGSDVRVTYNSLTSQFPSLIWTGSEYGVSWRENRDGNYEIYFAMLDSSGNKIGSDVRVTLNSSLSSSPSLIWTGNEYGVSWHDQRDGNYEIYFARLDSSGNKIGSDARITFNNSSSINPSITWTGSGFGVSWIDQRDGNSEIYFARIDPSGTKIGSDVRVTSDGSNSTDPSITWTGSEYGISWSDQRDTNYEIYFARVDSSGSKIGSDERITGDPGSSSYPCLIWTGSEYGVSWQDNRDGSYEIYVARILSSGSKVGSDVRASSDDVHSQYPSLVWTGSEYGVSWQDPRDGINSEIYFARLGCCEDALDGDHDGWCWNDCDPYDASIYPDAPELCDGKDNDCDGTVDNKDSDEDGYIDYYCSGGTDCDDNNANINQGVGEILCNGQDENCNPNDDAPDNDSDGYDVCGPGDAVNPDGLARDCNNASADIHPGATETCDGTDNDCDGSLDEGCDTICDNPGKIRADVRVTNNLSASFYPSLAWSGSEYGVVWEDNRDGNYELYFARIDSSGNKIGSDTRITNYTGNPENESLLWTGNEYALFWDDTRHGNPEIYFARIDPLGNRIGSEMRVTKDQALSDNPSPVWTGTEFGVAWQEYRDSNYEIYFARLDASGNKIGSDVRLTYFSNHSYAPSLVWTGSEYGVSWHDYRNGNSQIYFARISSSGSKIGSDVQVTNDINDSLYPTMSWTGSEYGICWHDNRNIDSNEIFFARLNSSGTKIGSDIQVTDYDLQDSAYPDLDWTGSEYGVAWEDVQDGNLEIYFARLDPAGNKIGTDQRMTNDMHNSYSLSLIWTGSEHGIAWSDDRSGVNEIYFAQIDCCDDDADADTYDNCADCDDHDPYTYPGATELCDYRDNDCDGTVDEGFVTPGPTTGLHFDKNKQTILWEVVSTADRYDVVKGDLKALRASKGDFTSSLIECRENDSTDTQTNDPNNPSAPGEGFHYLVRAQGLCKRGTYNTGLPSQIGDRDAEIEASPNKCP